VVEEVGGDALLPPGVALLEEAGVLLVERLALAPGEAVVEDVADDPAGEGEAVAADVLLLLEEALPDEGVDRLVEVPDLLDVLDETADLCDGWDR
jgi:hypothetical protein